MSGILAVYSLVAGVLIVQEMDTPSKREYSIYSGCLHLASGLSVGLTSLAAGYCIGTVGNTGVLSYMLESKVFIGMVLILIFAEVLGLYG
jgi:V-type H+-transporting ATPase 16kDa proteolipid subunit